MNLLLDTDSYKASHFLQFPPKTTSMFNYLESRGGRYNHTLFFGLQYIMKKYLEGSVVSRKDVMEANEFYKAHGLPFNGEGWSYIAENLNGKLPIRIRAVAEGSIVPTHNVLMTVESTDPKTFWIVGWLETLLMRVWYPITVATQSYYIKQLIRSYLEETSDTPDTELPFKLHDFGARGVSSYESASIGGAAHLVNFMGSDTVCGVVLANTFYNDKMSGFSIPAAEHSTMTMWGPEREEAAYRNMLTQFAKPGKLLAVVSDSYDLENAIDNIWGQKLRAEVEASGATVVIRPDSGDPANIVVKCLDLLASRFGASNNTKHFRVLSPCVRLIQGDGIDEDSIQDIYEAMIDRRYSASNIAFGMGGALLQQVNRDTQKFAFKCSSAIVDGKRVAVFKDPVTDPGKKSKAGKLDLIIRNSHYETVVGDEQFGSALKLVFENGEVKKMYDFDEVRRNSNNPLPL